jgi:hypothetical protein
LDVGFLVFSPGEVYNSTVVGEEERTDKKKKERKKEFSEHLTSA